MKFLIFVLVDISFWKFAVKTWKSFVSQCVSCFFVLLKRSEYEDILSFLCYISIIVQRKFYDISGLCPNYLKCHAWLLVCWLAHVLTKHQVRIGINWRLLNCVEFACKCLEIRLAFCKSVILLVNSLLFEIMLT